MKIITVEEHFHHPGAMARVQQLGGPAPIVMDDSYSALLQHFMPDRDSAERLGGRRLTHMDRVGIDVQVVSHGANNPGSLDHHEAIELCRDANDALAQSISEHPTRFRGFATIPLYDPSAAADEMRRCVNDLGFVGTLVMGTCGGTFLDDERFDPVLSAAEEVDLPIYLHPGLPTASVSNAYYSGNWPGAVQWVFAGPGFGWHAEAGIHVLRMILSGALDRHPNLKLLSGHWGEFVAGWLDRLDEVFAWCQHLDRPVSQYYRDHVWITPSGMFNQNRLKFILAELGHERIIYSEDYPYVESGSVSEFLESAELSEDQRASIAHRNAENLLHI
ncbi:amidohydrolase family protein [Mycolicibacterium smegmatis]|uniref:Amidohydrolase family protein n=1 Tax=Mycolicibacterium smegmatis (strain MKD8) TaxID=1214915 RepID=A0A2U9PT99_MYCSE|nr:amidohydrolase family protein [Mycolicibacterium smegmatis]AWT55029.1 amidohydrolase family protein [Mycolicibacterium smegmatis MKD8]